MKTVGTTPQPDGYGHDGIKPGGRQYFLGCLVIFLLFAGLVVVSILIYDNVLEKYFDFFIYKDNETTELLPPDEAAPIPDIEDLIEFKIIEKSLNHLNVGVKPDVADDEIERLNLYLSQEHFLGFSMFNIAYLNRDAPESGEVIAVYNYNEFTGTKNLTILPKEPGLRFPIEDTGD